ncbi:beta-ketoacyl synthase N-terminal-like domain-containing protein [Collimonas humicola]|uniref:beta-ketoacyl synthase N-terminal-like domain-containing protein n=1 Tax=Collimonas humicola TaxID=2825886 RepID=UPI001B8D8A8E|nr:beta-ketoacyl synthase N-terminal-like domain-containing protein [Collimonas humicola]
MREASQLHDLVSTEPLAMVVGLGAVSPIGDCVAEFWDALFQQPADPTVEAIAGFPEQDQTPRHAYAMPAHHVGCEVRGCQASRFESIVAGAIEEALADAGWDDVADEDLVLGFVLGTAAGDTEIAESLRCGGGVPRFAEHNSYRLLDRVGELTGRDFSGPMFAMSNACSAGLYALTQAAELIASGSVDAMCVVSADVLSRVTQASFHRMTALDPERCRPFDADRQGTVFGEGAAAMLLVSPAVAKRLERRAYCQVRAYGASCDAFHPTSPQPQGRDIGLAIKRALENGRVSSEQIQLMFPHGTGTPMNDRIESDMIEQLFDCSADDFHVLPIKAHIGHCAGASGNFAALVAAKAISLRTAPPTLHIRVPDPDLPLPFPKTAISLAQAPAVRVLVNAYAFGGSNISILLEAPGHG